jgi:phage/conjugal plasmid C-4 type zinc finger TraR family protein
MANGWAGDTAVHDQIESDIADGVERARQKLSGGEGRRHCLDCGDEIPAARRRAVPAAVRCLRCQAEADDDGSGAAFNRRGSKDSQLR